MSNERYRSFRCRRGCGQWFKVDALLLMEPGHRVICRCGTVHVWNGYRFEYTLSDPGVSQRDQQGQRKAKDPNLDLFASRRGAGA